MRGAITAFVLLASSLAHAEAPPLLARLDESARAVTSLRGEFVQKNRIKLFKQAVTSKGRFFYQRPRKIRWEYLEPDPSTLVLDGNTATMRSPGAAPQVFDLARDATMRAVFDQLLMWVGGGGGMASLEKDYAVVASGTQVTLTPKPGGPIARAFSRIELRFDGNLLLQTILLRESSGDEKEIAFSKMERNAKLPSEAFKP